ncbi:SDR family NAD(P)-dependent oxidoreductase, partial [Trichocoleus sp. FACHB-262]|uniref:SDR family NAD(P)-dependent oxidoreductase n=1 Tax=Trichocoleus sp. FACHB-262 TaxID=2692869 RepID=UPI002410B968
MSRRMDGKAVIVTGGSSGIGRATAIAFAREGAQVVIAARRATEGEETVKHIVEAGGEAIFIQTDVTQANEVQALINRTLEQYGRLDAAFNNAELPSILEETVIANACDRVKFQLSQAFEEVHTAKGRIGKHDQP